MTILMPILTSTGTSTHAPIEADGPQGYYQHLTEATRSLLIEKGLFSADAMRAMIEKIDERSPALGARIVARAWTDPAFRERLLARGKQTIKEEMEIDPVVADIVVVENTAAVHNVVVCTLCSCYPVFILGRPPDWYKSYAYRSRAVRDPRGVLQRVRHRNRPGTRSPRPRFDRRHALPGAALAARRHGRLGGGKTGGIGHPRHDGRRRRGKGGGVGGGATFRGVCAPPSIRPGSGPGLLGMRRVC